MVYKKKQYQSYVFLLFQTMFFIIYHPNASANNEIQAVFHFGLFIIRFSSSTIPLIEPYSLNHPTAFATHTYKNFATRFLNLVDISASILFYHPSRHS